MNNNKRTRITKLRDNDNNKLSKAQYTINSAVKW